jgi:translocation and assembly module TamB
MTNPSLPDRQNAPPPNRRPRFPWRLVLWLLFLGGGAALAYWAWYFVHEQLAPTVSEALSKQLNRPVKIGRLERFSPVGLRFGATELPATAKDKDWATSEAVEVGFDPWRLLWQRSLDLKVTLVKPDSFFDESKALLWVETKIESPQPGGPISIALTELRLEDGKTTLIPLPKKGQKPASPIRFKQLNGLVKLLEDNQRFQYDLSGESLSAGTFDVQGETRNLAAKGDSESKLDSQLTVSGKNFPLLELDRLIRLPIDLKAGRADGKVKLAVRPDSSVSLQGGGKFKGVNLIAPGAPKPILDAMGELELQDTKILIKQVKGKFDQIPVTAKGSVDPKKGFDLQAKVPSVTLAMFFKTFDIKSPVPVSGEVAADIQMKGPIEAPIISGTTRNLKPIVVDRIVVSKLRSQFELNADTGLLQLRNAITELALGGQTVTNGTIALKNQQVNLSTRVVSVPGDAVAKLYNDNKPPSIKIGDIIAVARTTGTPDTIQTLVDWEAPQALYPAKGQVFVAEGGDRLELRSFYAKVLGGTITAKGQAIKRQWQGQVDVANLPMGQFDSQLRGLVNGQFNLAGTLDNFDLAAIRATGVARLSQGIAVVNDPIDARLAWDGKQINLLSATAPGLQASGTIAVNLKDTPEVTGIDLFVKTQGLLLSSLPLGLPTFAAVSGGANFDGRISGLPTGPTIRGRLGLPDLRVNGLVFEPLSGAVAIVPRQGLQLDLAGGRDRLALNLDSAFQPLSAKVVRGELDLNAQRQGELFNVAIANFPLDTLNGLQLPIPFLPQQLAGRLSGNFAVNLTRQELIGGKARIDGPRFDQFQAQQLLADLRYVGGVGDANVQVFGAKGAGVSAPNISAQVRYRNGAAEGTIAVAAPQFGSFKGDDVKTAFRFNNNVLRLAKTELRQGDAQFIFSGDLNLAQGPRLRGDLTVKNGNIQDVLGLAQIFRLDELAQGFGPKGTGRSRDLSTVAVGSPQERLQQQIDRLSEIKVLLSQIAESRSGMSIPELADVRGLFDAKVSVDAALNGDINGNIELTGKTVEWRPFPSYVEESGRGNKTILGLKDNRIFEFDQVTVLASIEKGVIDLNPVQLQFKEGGLIELKGKFGGPQIEGANLIVTELPIAQLRKFYDPPVDLTGNISSRITISGLRSNPSATGTITLTDGTIRGTPISSADFGFGYEQANLNFGGTVTVDKNPNPLTIDADIPFAIPLPFITAVPKTTEAKLNLKVSDDGLALLSLFTDQVAWVSGKGNVDLAVRASLWPPAARVDGDITLNNAVLASASFPENPKTGKKELLTGVNGRVRFEGDRLRVTGLQDNDPFLGQFSNGQVAGSGVLPLLNGADPEAKNGLNLSLQKIALTFKGLYQGGVDGDVTVKGTALAPLVGGEVRLTNGRVLLADAAPPADAAEATAVNNALGATGFKFVNLKLILGNNLRIVKAPIINFVAKGELLVNGGNLANLQLGTPEGSEIQLLSGQVNLFTTQFVLARGYRHRAVFKPDRGQDPELDVRLIASVPEVSRSRVNNNTLASEVNDSPLFATGFGSLQTVRIQAKVSGLASSLFQNLELTSSPGRTRNEIIGLLGGGFINTLGRGDSTLGIANLAGSALLTNIQGFIGNALGLSEFRLFPTITTDDRKQSSTLGLAAEAGIDITPAISASVLRVLTAGQSTQFGLRYRVNDSFLFRGSTDFSGDNRAVLEYESRF